MIFPDTEFEYIIRVLLATILGGIIGWEREHHVGSVGIRTYSAIALGACVFSLVSLSTAEIADGARIASNVVVGIGFIGAGLSFRQGSNVAGLTSAATIWATASVGLAIAFGLYSIGFLTAFIIFILLFVSRMTWWQKISSKKIASKINDESNRF